MSVDRPAGIERCLLGFAIVLPCVGMAAMAVVELISIYRRLRGEAAPW